MKVWPYNNIILMLPNTKIYSKTVNITKFSGLELIKAMMVS